MLTFSKLGRVGRNGNAMFQIASVIGLATKLGYEYGFPEWKNYDQLERFGGGEDIDIQKWFKNPLPPMAEGDYTKYNWPWGYHEDKRVKDWTDLVGHFQSEKYFLHCEELIRHYFTFKHETERKTNTVAVHFRGGDYGGDYHPTCTREYYRRAFDYFEDGFKFLLFTDDPERAKEVIPFPFELAPEGHSMEHLEMMSKCDAHIIANSTFSWWGAWLADSRRVIAPAHWFGPAAKLDASDIYPENWIVI